MSQTDELREAVLYLYKQRLNIPQSIYYGQLEEALLELQELIDEEPRMEFVKRPYSGLKVELELLIKLVRALRYRMEQSGTYNVSGLDYLSKRIDMLISRLQYSYNIW